MSSKGYLHTAVVALGLAIICSTSCSIQKRRYQPGYYFSFKSNPARVSPAGVWHKPAEVPKAGFANVIVTEPGLAKISDIPTKVPASATTKHQTKTRFWQVPWAPFKQQLTSLQHNKVLTGRQAAKASVDGAPESKLLVTALLGFIFSIVAAMLVVLGAYLIIQSEFVAIFFGLLVLVLGAIMLLAAFFLNLAALIQKSVTPEAYWGEWMAFVGMFICLVTLGIFYFFVIKK